MSAPPAPAPAQSDFDKALLDIKSKFASPAQLRSAKRKGLVYIAKLVNTAAHCKHHNPKIKTTGTVEELRDRVASFLEVDLSAPDAPTNNTAAGLTTHVLTEVHAGIGLAIRQKQWSDLQVQGRKVLSGEVPNVSGAPLPSVPALPAVPVSTLVPDMEGQEARALLENLQIQDAERPIPSAPTQIEQHFASAQLLPEQGPAHPLSQAPLPSAPPPQGTSTAASAAAILADIDQKIEQLKKVKGLRQAIQQVENGEVQAIRDALGRGHPRWGSIKNVVTRREKAYKVLEMDFKGDKEKFFNYFTRPETNRKKRKSSNTMDDDKLYSFAEVSEHLIPAVLKGIAGEKSKDRYLVNGAFSEVLWEAAWGEMNRFEIMDAVKAEAKAQEEMAQQQQQLD